MVYKEYAALSDVAAERHAVFSVRARRAGFSVSEQFSESLFLVSSWIVSLWSAGGARQMF